MKIKTLSLVSFAFLVQGCSHLGPESNFLGGGRVTTASPNGLFEASFEKFGDEQLLQLIDPRNLGSLKPNELRNFSKKKRHERIIYLRKAFHNANTIYGAPETNTAKAHRSQIQDRIMAASEQRCNLYETYLKRLSSINNGIFGVLTTSLGGAGAIVGSESAARLLSGLAGISSGTRAELNQAIFESVATSVIVPAIRVRRREMRVEILPRRKESLVSYTVEAAVADAIRYHGACSMDSGIGQAQRSLQSFEDIGVERFRQIQQQQSAARSASMSFELGPISSLTLAERAVSDLTLKVTGEFAEAVRGLENSQSALKGELDKLSADLSKTGEIGSRAAEIDSELQQLVVEYASSFGVDRSSAFTRLQGQQLVAREFEAGLLARAVDFRRRLAAVQ